MEEQIRVVVYSNDTVFDDLIIASNAVTDYTKYYRRLDSLADGTVESTVPNFTRLKLNRRGLNAYLVSAYIHTLKRSGDYRQAALKTLLQYSQSKLPRCKYVVIYIKLQMPTHQSLDYKWNERVTQMALERRELDHAMSWLSTLGGGFSALGETFEHCAEMAGKISVRQLQLALRLGDPLLVARCKLWAALSLLQRGYLEVAKNLVRENYRLGVEEKDVRLQNMCKGIWAKLQYTYKLKRELKAP